MKIRKTIQLTINGQAASLTIDADERLSTALRNAGFRGVKEGCDEGVCGACTVLMDGKAVNSCVIHAWQAHDRNIETIEGLGSFEKPHALQQALADEGAVQCGFCMPGLILSAVSALRADPGITEEELMRRMDGHLCRCTGYEKIQAAIRRVLAAREQEVRS